MSPIQLQLLSDLHLESPKAYDIFKINPTAPYLALIGDIGCIKDVEYVSFLQTQLSQFRIVFLVLGNHEPYHSTWIKTKEILQEFQTLTSRKYANDPQIGSFVLLDQTRYDISPSVTILGCTLFSHIIPEQKESVSFGINDFYYIEDWSVEVHNEEHVSDLDWLNSQVKEIEEKEPDREIIILTHYCPTVCSEAVDPAHAKSKISSCFASDLRGEVCWSCEKVKIWGFGHTHFNCDFFVGGEGSGDSSGDEIGDEGVIGIRRKTPMRVVANQRGYYFREAVGFDERKVVEI